MTGFRCFSPPNLHVIWICVFVTSVELILGSAESTLRTYAHRASAVTAAALLSSKIQMGPRTIPIAIAGDVANANVEARCEQALRVQSSRQTHIKREHLTETYLLFHLMHGFFCDCE